MIRIIEDGNYTVDIYLVCGNCWRITIFCQDEEVASEQISPFWGRAEVKAKKWALKEITEFKKTLIPINKQIKS